MNKERKNKRRLTKKEKSQESLKIFSPDGRELLYTGLPGFCIDYRELLRQKKRKSLYKDEKGSY